MPTQGPLQDALGALGAHSGARAGSIACAASIFVYADGACRGNPGPSGAGWVLCSAPERAFAEGCLFLGTCTNNEAEYAAATLGLQAAFELGHRRVVLRADSELMIRQLTGRYQVRNARLRPLYEALLSLSRKFEAFEAQHVRREFNRLADAQANRAIDEKGSDTASLSRR